jgi:hypothetical protein
MEQRAMQLLACRVDAVNQRLVQRGLAIAGD